MASGFGGIERVAHQLASSFDGEVFSLDVPIVLTSRSSSCLVHQDWIAFVQSVRSLVSSFAMPCIVSVVIFSRAVAWSLALSRVLLLLFLARIVQPNRHISAHWHSFLARGSGLVALVSVYQKIALRLVSYLSAVVCIFCLASELQHAGVSECRIFCSMLSF